MSHKFWAVWFSISTAYSWMMAGYYIHLEMWLVVLLHFVMGGLTCVTGAQEYVNLRKEEV